jgi:hypothetical protein
MKEHEFQEWLAANGYSLINDWNFQKIGESYLYFIKNEHSNLYALIEEDVSVYPKIYKVLVKDWKDYNGW